MANFSPQLVIPAAGNPYYNTKKVGGYNPCIMGNPKNRNKDLNVLPNCVGYVTGRFNEIGAYGSCKYLGNTNAANYIDLARKQGLTVTQRPTVGGCMVWKGGNTGEGHVAIVEMDLGNRVITSESEYYGKQFVIYQRFGDGWKSGCYWMGASYTYLGCIKNPAVKPEEKDMTKAETEQLIREMFPGLMAAYLADLAKQPADAWAQPAIDYCQNIGIMVGDPDGNFRPQSPVKREEMAALLKGLITGKE